MKLIVAGSRHFTDYDVIAGGFLRWWLDHDRPNVELVSGGARGVDLLGERVAKKQGFEIVRFPADWAKYGGWAGPRRNAQMAEYADALLAFPMDESRGTRNMIAQATMKRLDVTVIELTP